MEPACAICGSELSVEGGHYIVRMDIFADPAVPPIDTGAGVGPGAGIAALLEQMRNMTAEELQDQVHRRFEFKVCGACQRLILNNPLGQPRHRAVHVN